MKRTVANRDSRSGIMPHDQEGVPESAPEKITSSRFSSILEEFLVVRCQKETVKTTYEACHV